MEFPYIYINIYIKRAVIVGGNLRKYKNSIYLIMLQLTFGLQTVTCSAVIKVKGYMCLRHQIYSNGMAFVNQSR